jgi:hypothetical protein
VGDSERPELTRIVSEAGIRLDSRKSVRPFKGIICDQPASRVSGSHVLGARRADGSMTLAELGAKRLRQCERLRALTRRMERLPSFQHVAH